MAAPAAVSTATDIANRALTLVGSAQIADIDDVTVREGKLCNTHYVGARQSQIRLHPWKFARARIELSTIAATPPFDYTAAFDVPTDMLRLVQVGDGLTSYQLEQGQILIDADEVDIYYLKDITDVTKWDTLFIEVITHYLAWLIAMPLTDDKGLKKQIHDAYMKLLPKARHVDSGEGPMRSLQTVDWLDSRSGGYGTGDPAATAGAPR